MSRFGSVVFVLLAAFSLNAQEVKRLEPKDAERLKNIRSEELSSDGKWLGYVLGEGGGGRRGPVETGEEETSGEPRATEVILLNLDTNDVITVPDGNGVRFSKDGRFAAYTVRERIAPTPTPKADEKLPAATSEKPPEVKNEVPAVAKPEVAAEIPSKEVLKPETPEPVAAKPEATPTSERPRGEGRRRGGGGRRPAAGAGARTPPASGASPTASTTDTPPRRPRGQIVVLRNLSTGKTIRLANIAQGFSFSDDSQSFAYVETPENEHQTSLRVLDLTQELDLPAKVLFTGKCRVSDLNWSEDHKRLYYYAENPEAAPPVAEKPAEVKPAPDAATEPPVKEGGAEPVASTTPLPATEPKPAEAGTPTPEKTAVPTKKPDEEARPVHLWCVDRGRDAPSIVLGPETPGFPKDRELSRGNARWTSDQKRVFVTLKKTEKKPEPATPAKAPVAPEKAPATSAKAEPAAEVAVWHWKDQRISAQRAKRPEETSPALLYVFDPESSVLRSIGDDRIPNFALNESGTHAIATDDDPYQAALTWDRQYSDYYLVDVKTGNRTLIGRRSPRPPRWFDQGRSLLWFESGAWFRIDPESKQRTNLTAATGMTFEVKEHDGEGTGSVGHVLPNGREVLISDGFDLWAVPLDGSPGRNITRNGNTEKIRYRHIVFDEKTPFATNETQILVGSFSERTKSDGFYLLDFDSGRLERLIVADRDFGNPRKAKNAERYLLTIQRADEYPNLWVAEAGLKNLRQVTDANPWLKEYDLPRTELIDWRSADGESLQGVALLPAGYESGRRYPTIVYMYEKLSQGLHNFRAPGMNLNPQTWAQQGYLVFMPDITYELGRPGPSAVKCVVPGVHKLIDMGFCDPDRVGLCGHSWGGYETAYIITQTKLFRAAVAGAPVVNMTSAYNGIRWETGLPRQFQYERTQSRIGGTLWEFPERFIANSPIFHLEHVTTPVLIMFGNNDGAVPWYQGIEYYLGMRRLGKPAVLLEYKNEGHGLRGKANIEDYTTRLNQWFDHYLKGSKPAPWIDGPEIPRPLEVPAPSAAAGDPAK